ncbi:MAG: AbrB/MazE/SpoVT family DNA-binding domain-containing protein [Bacteroidetes bacterium]|nr:AbrB/MazE/SpoVT family DNA-binding domain-containing protein [Bacteroidota bacterium]
MATVTSKGQVTLPKSVRDALGIEPGTEVDFDMEEGRVVMRKRPPVEALAEWEGRLRGKLVGDSVDETMEMMRGERVRDEDGA